MNDPTGDDGQADPERGAAGVVAAPAHSTGWVARRLGIAPATLRTWHRRYRIGPTGRTEGGHRRYLPKDLDQLERMRRLVLSGMPTAEAARVSSDPDAAPPATTRSACGTARVDAKGARTRTRRLGDAAMSLDEPAVALMLADTLRRRGVVPTWTQLIVPVLGALGERYARRGDCLAAEHLFSECVRTTLVSAVAGRRRWDGAPPALLACPDQELHSLPLYALASALAELGCPTRVLGASVPVDQLIAAERRVAPRAVFLWAHSPTTARPAELDTLPRRRPPTHLVVGGPGWRDCALPSSVTRVDSLVAAIAAVSPSLFAGLGSGAETAR